MLLKQTLHKIQHLEQVVLQQARKTIEIIKELHHWLLWRLFHLQQKLIWKLISLVLSFKKKNRPTFFQCSCFLMKKNYKLAQCLSFSVVEIGSWHSLPSAGACRHESFIKMLQMPFCLLALLLQGPHLIFDRFCIDTSEWSIGPWEGNLASWKSVKLYPISTTDRHLVLAYNEVQVEHDSS